LVRLRQMLSFERLLSVMVKRLPPVMLCAYDAREFDGPTPLEAIKAHPDGYETGLETLVG
jgi:hypothetical protein